MVKVVAATALLAQSCGRLFRCVLFRAYRKGALDLDTSILSYYDRYTYLAPYTNKLCNKLCGERNALFVTDFICQYIFMSRPAYKKTPSPCLSADLVTYIRVRPVGHRSNHLALVNSTAMGCSKWHHHGAICFVCSALFVLYG